MTTEGGERAVPSTSSFSRRSSMTFPSRDRRNTPLDNLIRTSSNVTLDALSRRNMAAERTVKRLHLSRALTIPDTTTVLEACRRMAARRVDAVLLTDSNALLCGILTCKDVTMRVIARELKLEETPVSKVMTRNPLFVLSDTLAMEALQKMVQGKFRHLPVVENGEVIALLDIAKCLHDAIARMERAAEKGNAIAAAVEGVERHWGASSNGPNTFIEALRERMFKPTLSTIIAENSNVVTVSPSDTVLEAAKKMLELRQNAAVVTVDKKPQGILTTKDFLMRVVAQNLPLESTSVEKVMTPNPECKTVDTPIIDALNMMHEAKFLHLPVVDRDGDIVSVVDVIHITHAAVATIGQSGAMGNESTNNMMQKFWDSALALGPVDDDDDLRSEASTRLASEIADSGRSPLFPPPVLPNVFGFKIRDKKGRIHRFNCGIHISISFRGQFAPIKLCKWDAYFNVHLCDAETRSLTNLITCIIQRLGNDIDQNHLPQILYEDEDHDKVILASDDDLAAAVEHAKLAGLKGLRLYLDNTDTHGHKQQGSTNLELAKDAWASAYSTVAAGAAFVAGIGVMAYLRK